MTREVDVSSSCSYLGMDAVWFVLRGPARFFGTGNSLIGEVGLHEGIFLPRDVPYRFESIGSENLKFLQLEATSRETRVRSPIPVSKAPSIQLFRRKIT